MHTNAVTCKECGSKRVPTHKNTGTKRIQVVLPNPPATKDIADATGISQRLVYAWRQEGKLDARRIGRENRYVPESVEATLASYGFDVVWQDRVAA